MHLSAIRSALSEDSPRGRATLRQQELSMEVQRLRRKNALLEKGRQVLEEEVRMCRDEIQSKNRKIQQLSTQLSKTSINILPKPQNASMDEVPSERDVILLEKEEQLGVASQALRVQEMRIQQLQSENAELREQLSRSDALLRQIRESSRAQLSFQNTQIATLEQELMDKDRQIAIGRVLAENLANKEHTKWQKTVQNLRGQVRMWEEKTKDVITRHENYAQQRQQLRQKNELLQDQIQSLKEKIVFLESLLQEAKGAFIDVQLQQQEHLQRQHREKREYRKRNQLLKTQIKSLRGNSDGASTCDPSNKSTRTASTVSVTPFRTSSCRSKLIQQ